MKSPNSRLCLAAAGVLALALLAAWPAPALALEQGPFSMQVLVDGVSLEEHAARGITYIEALEGREYAIRLRNRTGRRIAVALSVDGLNSIDAKTTSARDAAKWILAPYQTVTIDGWQINSSEARRFFFTTEEKSYGAWLGKASNLGVISAAAFRERRPEPVREYHEMEEQESKMRRQSGKRAPASAAPGRDRSEAAGEADAAAPAPSDDLAATGIGRKLDHRVRRVRFEAEASPAAVVQLRYEYRDALVRLGVLPDYHAHREDPLGRRERARGFEDLDFAPDPFRRDR